MLKAIKLDYQDDFEKSLDALMDIQMLSEFTVSPLVSHAYFYLSEMKRKADAMSTGQMKELANVQNVLDQKMEEILKLHFLDSGRFKGYKLTKSTQNINLQKWNQLFDSIPEILSVTSLFNYHGEVEVIFDEYKLQINGLILEDGNIENNRKLIYVITRKLLRAKILLTFSLEKTARTGLNRLVLKADISHDENFKYRVPFKVSKDEKYIVGFSNILYRYRAHFEEVKAIGPHNVIEIDQELNVHHRFEIPELSNTESANKELLHFPFIFRPVSIILPVKGSLVAETFTRSLEDEKKRNQDVSNHFRTIDFFSLFNL